MINIFLDTTGSMSVMGKNSGSVYIVKSIEDYCSQNKIVTNLYKLNKEKITNVTSLLYQDVLLIDNFDKYTNSILISDGLFKTNQKNIFDISFLIGIDADKNNLEKISEKVYECENIISALEYLIYKNDINNNLKEEDTDDEW